MRVPAQDALLQEIALYRYGVTAKIVGDAVHYVHHMLDSIDAPLISGADARLSELVELANLSAIIGNLFRAGICRSSDGIFLPNAPHTYPDILANKDYVEARDIEIKVALENNKPKGHLVKPGPHITVRYVLADVDGNYTRGKANRGVVPWIWEVRIGELEEGHFNFSNTEGDSGKTAVINAAGMAALSVVYFDRARCPLMRGI
ncbi:hypothetical protein [Burkholderia multivorans]|uniref:hypothetical protein n=1 Tax=Burkholderia multivorans TaxID=87883 RepID=UPI00159171AB|nr:hypothetical protein [Burkholderia multivorans]